MPNRLSDVKAPARLHATLRGTFVSLLTGALLTIAGPSRATPFTPAFAGPGLDAGLLFAGSPGTGYSVGGGVLTLTLPAGTRTGDVLSYVYTSSTFTGDFTATVTADSTALGQADLGIVIGEGDFSDARADIFFNGNSNAVNANIFAPVIAPASAFTAAKIITFTVTRVGNAISEFYDTGSGATLLNAGDNPTLGQPTRISLFLLEAFEVADPSAETGRFVNFAVANGPEVAVLEPGSLAVLGSGLASLALTRQSFRRRRT